MVVFGRKGDKQGLVETKAAAGEQQRQVDAGSSSSTQGRRKCSHGALGVQGEWAPSEITPEGMQTEDIALDLKVGHP